MIVIIVLVVFVMIHANYLVKSGRKFKDRLHNEKIMCDRENSENLIEAIEELAELLRLREEREEVVKYEPTCTEEEFDRATNELIAKRGEKE